MREILPASTNKNRLLFDTRNDSYPGQTVQSL